MRAHLAVVIAFVHVVNLFHYGIHVSRLESQYYGLTSHYNHTQYAT